MPDEKKGLGEKIRDFLTPAPIKKLNEALTGATQQKGAEAAPAPPAPAAPASTTPSGPSPGGKKYMEALQRPDGAFPRPESSSPPAGKFPLPKTAPRPASDYRDPKTGY